MLRTATVTKYISNVKQCTGIDPNVYRKLNYITGNILSHWVKNDLLNKTVL